MKWDRPRMILVAFMALSLTSAIYLSAITLNYLNYYPALGTLTAQVDSVSIVPGTNYSRIVARVTVSNPSGYSGVELSEDHTAMFFVNENNGSLLFTGVQPQGDQPIGVQLLPHSSSTNDVLTQLYPSQASSLKSFASTSPIMANVTLTVSLTTFLTPAVGQYTILTSSSIPVSA